MNWDDFIERVNADPVIAQRGADSSFQVLLGIGERERLITVYAGNVVSVKDGPFVMPQCDFALIGSAEAWTRFCAPHPAPGEQDIFAYFRSKEILLTGDTRKFYAHLMFLKLMLLHLRSQA
ncbi:MAG: hypothetical protein JSU95_16605 [Betaproteobacteria bacterium]|nr:MAG: hypothetical protein JSU95_16605 [Betaproteobacteria bacterium]